jgi:hypothetical protein
MPNADFALNCSARTYDLGTGLLRTLTRPHLRLVPPGTVLGGLTCFVDTGTTLSVVSWGAARLFPAVAPPPAPAVTPPRLGTPRPVGPLSFQGRSCHLGHTRGVVLDAGRRRQSLPLHITAKFVSAPMPHLHNDLFVILGTLFLQENDCRLDLLGAWYGASGTVSAPV